LRLVRLFIKVEFARAQIRTPVGMTRFTGFRFINAV